MRGYFGGIVIGAIVGSLMTLLYINNEHEVEQKAKQVTAKSKRAVNMIDDFEEDMSDLIRR